jgi:diguanylate cyclase (GGDEF)-like protein/PAS domain S-box-containing protein
MLSRDITERKQWEEKRRESEERWKFALEGSGDGVWDWNIQTGDAIFSKRWKEMLGFAESEIANSSSEWVSRVHPDDMQRVMSILQAHIDGETASIAVEFRMLCKDGGWMWVLGRGIVVSRSSDGKPLRLVGTNTDITERKQAEAAIRRAASVFANSYDGVLITDANNIVLDVNPAFTRITGYSRDEIIGQTPKLLSSGRQKSNFYAELWESLKDRDFWQGEIWNRRKSGEVYAEMLSISVVRDDADQLQYYIGLFTDISQIKEHEAELDRIAHYDALTGVPNRRLFADRLNQAISHTKRGEKSLAVCYLDLDGFKPVNDQYGHAVGDELLVEVTSRLSDVLRAEDTLARLGGDEFVLLFTDLAHPEEIHVILDRVLAVVSAPILIKDTPSISVSASIGVTLYPEDNTDADVLLRHADQAMYFAKEAGKNRYHFFDQKQTR